VELAADWARRLGAEAGSYAQVALANIRREFPAGLCHTMNAPGDFPYRPRARTPVFYGSFDWHSCVQMHWLLVRLLRVAGEAVPASEITAVLSRHFERVAMAAEEDFIVGPDGLRERPYGWGWALTLVHEAASWDDHYGRKWTAVLAPLGSKLSGLFLRWLAKAAYPVRHGVHANSAFGLSRALPYAAARASSGEPALLEAITAKAHAWFGRDMLYPGGLEPSGGDFLSPALTEAELMAQVLSPGEFAEWLAMFLPGIERGEPATLFIPVEVTDPSDGDFAHLHGLNASRAWCWRRLAEALPEGDPRISAAVKAARMHAEAALPHVVGEDYMIEHWLAAYAVLMLS
jgi:Protein of unknown function (DUF2891)